MEEFENCIVPSPETTVWKYMNFPEFISLLQFKKLYFTRVDELEDKLEGSVPEFFLRGINNKDIVKYNGISYESIKNDGSAFINCWSEFKKESYAMWQIYSKKYGIAIQTTVDKLNKMLNNRGALIRRVKYIDYDGQITDNNLKPSLEVIKGDMPENLFIFKPECYEYEKEIRAIIFSDKDSPYIYFDIDIEYLTDVIVVSPFADRWFVELVEEVVHKQYKLANIKVCSSGVEIKNAK